MANTYSEDALPAYSPMPWSLKEIRAAIPDEYFVRKTTRGLLYFARDVLMATLAWWLASTIDPYFKEPKTRTSLTPFIADFLRWAAWGVYWWFQGLIFTGIWVIGHECGHGAFSQHKIINDIIGFITHTNHASMERDEVYVPKTRKDLNIPDEHDEHKIDYDEIFGDTPIYTLYMLIRQQLLAFPAYLPNSILFTKAQRNAVIASNIGIAVMVWAVSSACSTYGIASVVKYYGIPWLEVTHWCKPQLLLLLSKRAEVVASVIMITYLHHTDPEIPHYRGKEWNFQRGAAATIDRNFLGWQGRFFLHDVAHFHVIHHFFPKMPFYHGPAATKHLKAFIGDHYASSDKAVFKALWDNYNNCQFVEDTGDVLFYRDKKGRAVRRPAFECKANVAD
ncbi:hypothetical protein H0H92_008578 [Tricholoma furcatifolium]|nr:hypothetical protein H0H92_008578 [Tricholoma furcatifolium]